MACVLRIAVPGPLRRPLDYLPPPAESGTEVGTAGRLRPGMRVKVPFGRTVRTGVLLETAREAEVEAGRLREAAEVLDEEPSLPPALLRLLTWAADYYHHPVGEVFHTAPSRGSSPCPPVHEGGCERRRSHGPGVAPHAGGEVQRGPRPRPPAGGGGRRPGRSGAEDAR